MHRSLDGAGRRPAEGRGGECSCHEALEKTAAIVIGTHSVRPRLRRAVPRARRPPRTAQHSASPRQVLQPSGIREEIPVTSYSALLVALPFSSELAQGLGIMPGTFDWVDVLLYVVLCFLFFRKETSRMQPLGQHFVGAVLVVVLALAVIGSGAHKIKYEMGVFQLPPQQKDEIWTKPLLATILQKSTNRAVVLRVPNPTEKVTGEQAQANSLIYSTIEKELAKAGFTVRDRQLFSKVLDQASLDYSKIGVLTETDLIVELVRFMTVQYQHDLYKDEKGAVKKTPEPMSFTGALIEFKLTGVKENDVVGTMVFRYSPCQDECSRKFSPELTQSADVPLDVEKVSTDFASRLVAQLNQYR